MVDLTRLKRNARQIRALARDGQDTLTMRFVLARVVIPLLQLIRAMETNRGERWKTLAEALRESGRGRNFFEKPLAGLDGKNRLEAWRVEGLADRTEEGLWLISPIKVAEARREGAKAEVATPAPTEPSIDVDAIAAEFTSAA